MGTTLKRMLLLTVTLLMLATSTAVLALSPSPRIHLLVPPGSAAYDDLAKAIRHALSHLQPVVDVIITSPAELSGQPLPAAQDLLIAIGDPVLPWARSDANRFQHTLNFLVSSTAYEATEPPQPMTSALFRDQPLRRQLALAQLLIPSVNRVVMLLDQYAVPPDFAELQQQSHVRFSVLEIASQPQWPQALSQLMTTHDVLLAQDDPDIYNRSTVRPVLLTTYHHGKVMIGPNRAFVEAGSFASVYSSSEQHLRQLTRMVQQFLAEGVLPPPQFPKEFSVIINHHVAAALRLRVPGETTLAHQLYALEKQR